MHALHSSSSRFDLSLFLVNCNDKEVERQLYAYYQLYWLKRKHCTICLLLLKMTYKVKPNQTTTTTTHLSCYTHANAMVYSINAPPSPPCILLQQQKRNIHSPPFLFLVYQTGVVALGIHFIMSLFCYFSNTAMLTWKGTNHPGTHLLQQLFSNVQTAYMPSSLTLTVCLFCSLPLLAISSLASTKRSLVLVQLHIPLII